jgi:hypothetical protein
LQSVGMIEADGSPRWHLAFDLGSARFEQG